MKKVAIVSCYFQKNYGSALQAYATQKILDQIGIDNETIRIEGIEHEIKKSKYKHYLKQLANLDIVIGKLGYINIRLRKKNPFSKLGKLLKCRDQAFLRFYSRYHFSKRYESFQTLTEDIGMNFSAVLLGSDQLWLPSNLDADYYTLNWVPDNIHKITYATSFGVSNIPDRYHSLIKQFINRIDCLSVREESGKKIIKEICGREANLVCDPTMLFDASEWMEIQNPEPIIKGKYIFCYFLGDNPEQREFVKKIANLTNCKIVAILHLNVYAKSDNNYADYSPFDIDPGEFLNLIRNAEYVCTDSFHASVFAIIYHKAFFTFRRFKAEYALSTNSRLDTLLSRICLSDRFFSGKENVKEVLNYEIDFKLVDEKLKEIRETGQNYLKSSLGKIGE